MNKTVKIILIVVGIIVLIGLLQIASVVLLAWALDTQVYEFDKTDNKYYINELDTNMEIINSEYNEDDACYVLELKVEKNSEVQKRFLGSDYLSFEFGFFDEEDYLLGEGTGSIEDFYDGNKWRVKVNYCEVDADEVARFELNSIEAY